MKPFITRENKYGAKPTNGYASKREAHYAHELGLRKLAINGDVADWLEQVPIKLQGGVKYIVDFMIIMRDGTVRFVEIKGFETATWKMKMKLLSESRPELFKRLEVIQ